MSFVYLIYVKYNSYTSVNCNIYQYLKTNTDQLEIYHVIYVADTAASQAPRTASKAKQDAGADTRSRRREGRGGRYALLSSSVALPAKG